MNDAVLCAPRPDEPSLRLHLFDGPRLELDGRPVAAQVTTLRVLAFLALHGPAARSTTAGSLWPEHTEDHALASLRTAVWRARATGHPLLTADKERLRLAPSLWVDSSWLAVVARQLLAGQSDGWERNLDVVRAARGSLLAGWYDDWVLVQRERLRQLRIHVLEDGSARLLRSGRFAAALDLALEVVEAEPLRESGHCAVISVHLAEGNYVDALRQFTAFRRLAAEELGVAPSPRMQALMRPSVSVPATRVEPQAGAVRLTRR